MSQEPRLLNDDTPARRVERGAVSAALDLASNAEERAVVKADAHVAALEEAARKGEPLVFDLDGQTISFTVPVRLPNGILETVVSAKGLPADANPFQFVNPPVMVEDATEKELFREDPEAAFRAILADAVRGALARSAKGDRR